VTMSDGRSIVVFGGINFSEERVFNDVHCWDTGQPSRRSAPAARHA
jgi:hypothetical protein